jgi:hypothetical protein
MIAVFISGAITTNDDVLHNCPPTIPSSLFQSSDRAMILLRPQITFGIGKHLEIDQLNDKQDGFSGELF